MIRKKVVNEVVERVARETLGITLETRNRDSLDFHDLHVGKIRAALEAAFEAGRVRGKHAEELKKR